MCLIAICTIQLLNLCHHLGCFLFQRSVLDHDLLQVSLELGDLLHLRVPFFVDDFHLLLFGHKRSFKLANLLLQSGHFLSVLANQSLVPLRLLHVGLPLGRVTLVNHRLQLVYSQLQLLRLSELLHLGPAGLLLQLLVLLAKLPFIMFLLLMLLLLLQLLLLL